MKMYKKSELEYKNGYVVNGENDIIAVDPWIVEMFNALEDDVQHAAFERENKVEPAAEPPKFSRKTERGDVFAHVAPDTPLMDLKVLEAERLMDEIDNMSIADDANDYLRKVHDLLVFANDDFVVDCGAVPCRFDLPTIGNPLKISMDDIVGFVMSIFVAPDEADVIVNQKGDDE